MVLYKLSYSIFYITARVLFLLLCFSIYSTPTFSQDLKKEFNSISITANKEKPQKLNIKILDIKELNDDWGIGHKELARFNFGSNHYMYISNAEAIPFLIQSLKLKRTDWNKRTPFTFILRFYKVNNWDESNPKVKMYYTISAVGKSKLVYEEDIKKYPGDAIFQDTLYPEDIGKRYYLKKQVLLPIEGLFVQLEMIKEDRKKVIFRYDENGVLIDVDNYPFFKERTKNSKKHLAVTPFSTQKKSVHNFSLYSNYAVIDFQFEGLPIYP